MNADPYAPPQAILERPIAYPPMPGGIRWQIMSGVYAATVSGALSLVGTLRSLAGATPPVYAAYNFTAALVVFGLAYGIYRGGRTCAVLLLLTFLLTRALVANRMGLNYGWPGAVIVLACYIASVIGTVRWHVFREAHRRTVKAAYPAGTLPRS